MSCFIKISVAVLFLFLLGGCGSAVVMNDQSQPLASDEAIVLINVRASGGNLTLATDSLGAGRNVTLKGGDNIMALRLKGGHTYRVSRYYARAFGQHIFRCQNPFEFTPTSGAMIYVGDIGFLARFSDMQVVGMLPVVSDNERVIISTLQQKYPSLFEKYRYQKVLMEADHSIDDAPDNQIEENSIAFGETSPKMLCRPYQREDALR